jgi:hypothetical protein
VIKKIIIIKVMKKTILTVMIGLAIMLAHAQFTTDTLSVDKPGAGYAVTSYERLSENDLKTPELRMYYSGFEMKTFARHHSRGMALLTVGTGLILGGPVYSAVFDKGFDNAYNLVRIGGVMSIIGTILQFEASTHMRDAGLILSGNGVGITVKINK